jgi:hypothetical protein
MYVNNAMKSGFAIEKIEEVNRIWRQMPVDHRHLPDKKQANKYMI